MSGYSITVTSGADLGRTLHADDQAILIGRSEQADLRLTDDTVSWEHARIVPAGRIHYLENLSAAGTLVGDERVSGRTRLRHDDRIILSPRCVLRFELAAGGGRSMQRGMIVLAAAIVILLVVIVAAVVAANRSTKPRISYSNYVRAYDRLEAELVRWTEAGRVPESILAGFRDAWRLEQARDYANAARAWRAVWSELLTLNITVGNSLEPVTLGELGSSDYDELLGLMGVRPESGQWSADDARPEEVRLKDALLQFTRDRTRQMQNRAEERG